MSTRELNKDAQAWLQLTDESKEPGAGKARYAAAMHLHLRGDISADSLELYRALAQLDVQRHPDHHAHVIRGLVVSVEDYLERIAPGRFVDVRQGIRQWKENAVHLKTPRYLEACHHIASAVAASGDPLADMVSRATPLLRWVTYDAYPRAEIGEAFADGHAFASIIGEDAPIRASDFDLGIFVIAPNTLYRDHKHKAPELYAPLTDPHRWRFAPHAAFEEKPAHTPVWNEPHAPHATLTGNVPFLCIFCWTRDVNDIAEVIPASDWPEYERHNVKS